ncbi:MAG TPA: HD domain-containing protein [Bacteroidia bacterium]|jgi:HD superfamily phosphohydrolase|nr:HD domain-containing protein [Bacteroidia bacterium]
MYNGTILDAIHGPIKLSEIEKWVISQKLFSRLRRIKQNTFLYYVFPSANHTRFEHSIGVMNMANEIYDNANQNCHRGRIRNEKHHESENNLFFHVKDKLKEDEILLQELRLAALLHDIGHGPLSHTFDKFSISPNQLNKIIQADNDIKKYSAFFDEVINKDKKTVHHETISCLFIIKLISKLKEENKSGNANFSGEQSEIIEKIDVSHILKMIESRVKAIPDIIVEGVDYTSFFSSIISSFPIDADRMDYLYRDSYFSGVNYGYYDRSRLLMSFIPVIVEKKVYLAIKESGIDAVIRFIQSRTHLFNQVYSHKTNRATSCMLAYACRMIDTPVIPAQNYDELENFYWENSDEVFLWKTLYTCTKESKKEGEALNDLHERKLWKRIYESKIVITKSINAGDQESIGKAQKTFEKFADKAIIELEKDGVTIGYDLFPSDTFKDYDKSEIKIVKKIQKDDGINYSLAENWRTYNKEFQSLYFHVYFFRLFLKRSFHSPNEFNEQRKKAIDTFIGSINVLSVFDTIQ